MSESPAETIRRAVAQLRDPVFCGDRATPAVADLLEVIADSKPTGFAPGFDQALKVARAYLGEGDS